LALAEHIDPKAQVRIGPVIMRVLLIGNYEYNRQPSMQRFINLLQHGLTKAGCDVHRIRPEPVMGRLKPDENGIGKWLGYLDRFVFFPLHLRRLVHWADVVHICDQANSVYVPWLKGKPNVVTCHDMMAIRSALGEIPQNPTRWSGRAFQRWILNGLRKAQRVVCVSEQTRIEFLRVAKLPPEQIAVTPNALHYRFRPMESEEAGEHLRALGLSDERPFLLHVGGNEWYKNREGVLRIFHHLVKLPGYEQHRLFMAGMPWTPWMRDYVKEAGLVGRIKELIEVSNEHLRALYSTAKALIFPSLQEGFGWPIIEAQACGCFVVTTNRAPMTEVGGDGALYIDPADEAVAAHTIAEALKDQQVLRKLGFLNVMRFSKEAMITGYLNAYMTVLAGAELKGFSK
jgi:glycosyltransferase involved in cell wall biosynthesis